MNTAIVVPTIRPDKMEDFHKAWDSLIVLSDAFLLTVWDGDAPLVQWDNGHGFGVEEVLGDDADLIYNFNDGVRNLGFAAIAKYHPEVEYIITLDDDTKPLGNTIEEHIWALRQKYPISWFNTLTRGYPRGFPYAVRQEAECVVSHGVWRGILDYDAPTQLVLGNPESDFYKGPIPKGCYVPLCGMCLAFKKSMLPYVYFAPMGKRAGFDRFADIWMGVHLKRKVDELGLAIVTGYASVQHDKASNVFTNLQKESPGLRENETMWKSEVLTDPYFNIYREKRERWERVIKGFMRG
ncbi:MAG: hypothetical protein WC822_04530 [Candidatus Paceibacterota bacterium]|jgi:hypothetical protein